MLVYLKMYSSRLHCKYLQMPYTCLADVFIHELLLLLHIFFLYILLHFTKMCSTRRCVCLMVNRLLNLLINICVTGPSYVLK